MPVFKSVTELVVATTGCFAASFLGFTLYRKSTLQDGVKREPYVLQAMGILQGYDVVTERLGTPLKMLDISSDPEENKVDPLAGNAKMKIPVTGSKGFSAYMYLWATRPPVTMDTAKKDIPEWTVNQLDIEIGPTYRWTFYLNKDRLDSGNLKPSDVNIPDDLPQNPS